MLKKIDPALRDRAVRLVREYRAEYPSTAKAIAGKLRHHSDAGSQYTSVVLTEHLALEQIAPSIGSVGDTYDCALMETINGLYKAECVPTTIFHDGPYKTIALGGLVQPPTPPR